MAVLIRMPEISAGTESAAIAGWMVSVGDVLSPGDALADIETDKATIEYAIEEGGTVAGFLAEIGDNVAVGTPIAVLASEGESAEDALAAAGGEVAADTQAAASAAPDAAPAMAEGSEDGGKSGAAQAVPAAAPAAAPVEAKSCATGASCETGQSAESAAGAEATPLAEPGDHIRRFASPIARRIARERGLDIAQIEGTGPGGRIVRRDVENAEPTASTPAAPQQSATPQAAPAAKAAAPAPAEREGVTRIPHTGMRRAIARRLTESKTTVPHYYLRRTAGWMRCSTCASR